MNHRAEFASVVCPACTLCCDDITITKVNETINPNHVCEKGRRFFSQPTSGEPVHFVAGNPTEIESAIEAAAKLLNRSISPLIFGLDHLGTQAQQAAWKIADALGATIDTTTTHSGRSSMFALQRVGKVTATLGEIASRSDLIVFWFCDPETTHPRLLERLNQADDIPLRKIIVVDDHLSETAKIADTFVEIQRDSVASVLSVIRGLVAGLTLCSETVRRSTGMELSAIVSLAEQLQSAKYGAIFYGQTTSDSVFDLAGDHLSTLIRDLNNLTRFVGMKLRLDSNAQSSENVLAWSSGYPFAINLNRRYPRYHWLEYSAPSVLARQECDAILMMTGQSPETVLSDLPGPSREWIDRIPSVFIGPDAKYPSRVSIQTRRHGFDERGEVCRNDDVSLPLTAVVAPDTRTISADDVLKRILEMVGN